jgi:hypothetical protein
MLLSDVFCVCALAFHSRWRYSPSNDSVSWLAGSNSLSNQSSISGTANYGTMGTASSLVLPFPRYFAAQVADASGRLWLHGEHAEKPCTHQRSSCVSVYVHPRACVVLLVCLFAGGYANDAISPDLYLSDLMFFNTTSQYWCWVAGQSVNIPWSSSNYGQFRTPASSNVMASRYWHVATIDIRAQRIYILGGLVPVPGGVVSDLWTVRCTVTRALRLLRSVLSFCYCSLVSVCLQYDISTGQWAWIAGARQQTPFSPVYPLVQGMTGGTLRPIFQAMQLPCIWLDMSRGLWLGFGLATGSQTFNGDFCSSYDVGMQGCCMQRCQAVADFVIFVGVVLLHFVCLRSVVPPFASIHSLRGTDSEPPLCLAGIAQCSCPHWGEQCHPQCAWRVFIRPHLHGRG